MISSDQVNFGENSFALQISIEIAKVRDGIAVVYGGRLKSPHGRQPPPGLSVICKGDDHGEFDLWIMPKSSIFLNSALPTASYSS